MSTIAGVSRSGSFKAFCVLWQPMLLGTLVVVVVWAYFSSHDLAGSVGFDFRGTLWEPARDIAAGRSPYPAPSVAAVSTGNPAVYPPLAFTLALPVGLLPWPVAVWLWVALLVAGALTGVWLLGVRDWRCYCVVSTSLPMLQGVLFGNLTLLLLLGVGAAWRWRDRSAVGSIAVAATVVAKLFLWPLLVWLLLMRRRTTLGWSVAGVVVLLLAPWAAIGFDGIRAYPALLQLASDLYGPHTDSLMALGVGFGLPLWAAQLAGLVVAVALLVLAVVASRRARPDASVFAICVLAGIVSSPIVWNYYLVLLVAPIAVLWPRLSWAWAALPAFYVVDRLPGGGRLGIDAPSGSSSTVWVTLHSSPAVGVSIAVALTCVGLAIAALRSSDPVEQPWRGRENSV